MNCTKKITERIQSPPFIGLSRDNIIELLLVCTSQIRIGREDTTYRVAFKAGIDSTALVKEYQLITSDHAIVDDAFTNDYISVEDLTKEHIFEQLEECNKGKHGTMATEVKVVVIFFQNRPTGMSPFSLLLATLRLQTNRMNFH